MKDVSTHRPHIILFNKMEVDKDDKNETAYAALSPFVISYPT